MLSACCKLLLTVISTFIFISCRDAGEYELAFMLRATRNISCHALLQKYDIVP